MSAGEGAGVVLNTVARVSLIEKVTLEQRLEGRWLSFQFRFSQVSTEVRPSVGIKSPALTDEALLALHTQAFS